ncbi:uncharacterized protein LOC128549543 [Mercenaria mercenaria]|uniref:uncharacterized protein LOC128549543 n=1 Tax=Mercenaria mercenaria TaxID=6596 RepID=UPI00234EF595|nr:uncharacterized protein LOC128549543 [Mercenaria mercenaria]
MAARKRTIEEIMNSDTDTDESDFEGFSLESDISLASDISDEETSDVESDDEKRIFDEWTRFSDITVDDFTARSGPNLPDGFDVDTAKPLDYFWLLFNAEVFADMARHTNSYARWRMEQRNNADPYWTDTSTNEIQAMVGMEILMGINQLPDSRMYWSKNKFMGNQGISEVMTCNR